MTTAAAGMVPQRGLQQRGLDYPPLHFRRGALEWTPLAYDSVHVSTDPGVEIPRLVLPISGSYVLKLIFQTQDETRPRPDSVMAPIRPLRQLCAFPFCR